MVSEKDLVKRLRREEKNWVLISQYVKGDAYITDLIITARTRSKAEHKFGNSSQKNVVNHPPLVAGHQAQHGRVLLQGLLIGRDYASRIGRATSGQDYGV